MERLRLFEEPTVPKKGFWRRQFQKVATKSQKKFDWIFGIILPIVCFVFDPIVFKSNGFGSAFLGNLKPFAYLLSFVSVMAMSAWLIWGAKLKWLNAFLAGLFLVGGIISLVVGVVLSPLSLIGLIILIGVLGFTPLFTSIVFVRNAFRAFQTAKPFLEKRVLIYAFALSALFSLVVPSVINLEIEKMLDNVKKGDEQTIRANFQTLRYVSPLVNFDSVILQYNNPYEPINDERMKVIVEEYEKITGEKVR